MKDPRPSVPSIRERFTQTHGRVHLTGLEALIRLSLEQLRRDRAAGLRMGALYCGYPGSPLAGLDQALEKLSSLLDAEDVRLLPALNEELAAGAICGSQMLDLFPHDRYDGVLGFWFGKAPGLDRALDVMRHSNFIGTSRWGGAVALVGDDPMCKSSSLPSHSETALAHAYIPVFYPSDSLEVLELGRHALALSRGAGMWTALKIVPEVADGGMILDLPDAAPDPEFPQFEISGEPFARRMETVLLAPKVNRVEEEVIFHRLEAARRYAHQNGLNPIEASHPDDRVGLVAAGRLYRELRGALERLGLGGDTAGPGIRLLRIQMPYPLDPRRLEEFATGLEEIVVIDERRSFLEDQVRSVLFNTPTRARVLGQYDASGTPWLARHVDVNSGTLAADLAPWLARALGRPEIESLGRPETSESGVALSVHRRPHFCSGCPHTRSTGVPDGAVAGGGIGCHTLALLEGRGTEFIGAMGSEGSQWIGLSRYVDVPHIFQNVGDGTYFHSGRLALRACVESGVNVTYRLLYNGVIAMTGGQRPVGMKPLAELVTELLGEGVRKVVAVSSDRRTAEIARKDPRIETIPREEYEDALVRLREQSGVSVLIYDQVCSNHKARLERRGVLPRRKEQVLIHRDVCEGCGDCGERSGCLSLWPTSTALGRKTQLHTTSCTDDRTCLDGECPAFVTAVLPPPRPELPPSLGDSLPPAPTALLGEERFEILMVGIGSTGVVTLDAILLRAAERDGIYALHLDQTGLAQRGGRVTSHCILSRKPIASSARVGFGCADACFALDPLSANELDSLARMSPDRTRTLFHHTLAPTAELIGTPSAEAPSLSALESAVAERSLELFRMRADALSELAFGSTNCANVVLLGAALQLGHLPLTVQAIEDTIRDSGIAVEDNLRALRLGRAIAHDPSLADKLLADTEPPGIGDEGSALQARRVLGKAWTIFEEALGPAPTGSESQRLLEHAAGFALDLVDYQSRRYAWRYLGVLTLVARAEQALEPPGSAPLTQVAARELYRVLAYKDEYEVARLLLRGPYRRWLERRYGGKVRLRYHLEPPLLRLVGLRRKLAVGRLADPGLWLLTRLRFVRGSLLDPFRWLASRKRERELAGWYSDVLVRIAQVLDPDNAEACKRIAEAVGEIRGFESVKLKAASSIPPRVERELARLRAPAPHTARFYKQRRSTSPTRSEPDDEKRRRV